MATLNGNREVEMNLSRLKVIWFSFKSERDFFLYRFHIDIFLDISLSFFLSLISPFPALSLSLLSNSFASLSSLFSLPLLSLFLSSSFFLFSLFSLSSLFYTLSFSFSQFLLSSQFFFLFYSVLIFSPFSLPILSLSTLFSLSSLLFFLSSQFFLSSLFPLTILFSSSLCLFSSSLFSLPCLPPLSDTSLSIRSFLSSFPTFHFPSFSVFFLLGALRSSASISPTSKETASLWKQEFEQKVSIPKQQNHYRQFAITWKPLLYSYHVCTLSKQKCTHDSFQFNSIPFISISRKKYIQQYIIHISKYINNSKNMEEPAEAIGLS